ncbi:antitoxin Xre/MbcA/ParS toxin-binding domain-containing protein [uncultured Sphingomonas sp.]|uniref:antitoxin Xre/MbcA/ParS toxin-binding domain-containing protein n=1 Tax=uncultured Sphingomonas sp. TaxID=158754 RepID=UPI0035CA951C
MTTDPDTTEVDGATPAAKKPEFKRFRSKFNAVKLSPDQASRQGQVARVAWAALGDREAVMAFLNTHDDALGARPLDLAVASAEGLVAVEQAIAARAAPRA